MAPCDVQVILQEASGLPKNNIVNTLHFEVNAPDDDEGLTDGIHAAYMLMNDYFSQAIAGMEVRVYDPGVNPGGPRFSKKYTDPEGGSAYAPAELACCLSYATVDDPLASSPRRRGRIYMGPFAAEYAANGRPPLGLITAILDVGEALASVGTAGNTTWMMRSQRDQTYAKIESIWVDDAWDIQRRRGVDATTRTVRDVQ